MSEGRVELAGAATGSDGRELRARWLVGSREACPERPLGDGRDACAVELVAPAAEVTFEVRDSAGRVGRDTVDLVVVADLPPVAVVTAPLDAEVYSEGVPVPFEGRVHDAEVAPVDLVAWWESSRDGALGSPAPPAADGAVGGRWALSAGSHRVVLWVEDPGGARGSDAVELTVVANTPPSVTLTSPLDGEVANLGDEVRFTARVADAEQDPSTLALTWTSDVDGLLSTQGADASGQVSFVLAGLSPGPHFLTALATDDLGLSGRAEVLLFVNQVPTAPLVAVEPPFPGDDDDLAAVLLAPGADAEGDPITYAYAWFVDGTPGPMSPEVPAEVTTPGQTWEVVVTPSDPFGAGPPARASVTIGEVPNRPPEVTSVVLEPPEPRPRDLLVAAVTAADPDGDEVALSFTWYVDGVALPASGPTLDGDLWFDKHQQVWVEVIADDGVDASEPAASAPVEVRNTPPTAPSVRIDPQEPRDADDLWCRVTEGSTDADADAVTYVFAWTVDGVPFGDPITTLEPGDTVPAERTSCPESWTCTAVPDDGEDLGEQASDEVALVPTAGFGPPRELAGPADLDGPWSVFATDLDGDGDADALSASRDGSRDAVAWFENLGNGAFGAPAAVSTDVLDPMAVFASDLDGDGDPDVLSASSGDGKVAWYQNLGGAFGSQQVVDLADAPGAVVATDVDGDGDPDVLFGDAGMVAWHANLGGGAFGTRSVVSTVDDGNAVVGADLDGDGDTDILAASGNDDRVVWYANLDGVGGRWSEQLVSVDADLPISVVAVDLDGDADLDVLVASHLDDTVAWYENLGGAFGPEQVLAADAIWATSVTATDLDRDGDADVLSASAGDDTVGWYQNLGGGRFADRSIVTAGADYATSVYAVDLDGDEIPDVLSASFEDDRVAWYRNIPECP